MVQFFVADRNERRNITAGQKAIAAAEAWKQAKAEGLVQGHGGGRSSAQSGHLIAKPREHFGALFAVSKNYVDMARTVGSAMALNRSA